MILTKEEYVKKELAKLKLKPSKQEILLKRIYFDVTIEELNKIISKYKELYNDEIKITSEYDDFTRSSTIVIKVITYENEKDFNARLKVNIKRIEADYNKIINMLQT